ncbi:ABC transporter ATP-binding protein [Aureimonas sp. Leaf454]|uniref:ABC transporter ATP-binding protein n=1 Tax=Aureimonas sp. Leaf454 TaxID=1736381 RepID=UPI001FCD7EEC|nr:ABC transporter ATP-binding protein [Aureimonas sp. Leaf454]
MAGITKRFGTFAANASISLDLAKGEIVALLGENGAGKTTLMNILFGHYTPDEGSVWVDGRRLPPGRPKAAIEAGIGMVHQHFTLAPNLTVLENVAAGTQGLLSPRLDEARVRRRLTDLSDRFGLAIDPGRRVGDLSVGEQQRTEILKALYGETKILVLDEPTAVLTPAEAEGLFSTLRRMAAMGLSVIFISHKLHEVLSAADRVVVLRGGRLVGERRTGETSREELAELMVGRRVERPVRARSAPGPVVLEAKDLTLLREGRPLVRDASFTLRAGEILGLIGVSGNGQSDLARLLFGLERPSAGTLTLLGRDITAEPPRARILAGIGRIPEDRNRDGVVADMNLWENAVLERIREPRFSRLGLVRRKAAKAFARHVSETFDVRGGTPDTRIRLLSGGNVQKMILGRTLDPAPAVIVAAQPTRGLDEGAVAAVQAALLKARAAGTAILLISEDLDEVLQLADRTLAIHAGRLSDPVPTEGLDARRLGLMIAGEPANAGPSGTVSA